MAQPFPYTYYSCSCVDATTPTFPSYRKSAQSDAVDEEEEEQTFDPRSPRANFSLYPLEHLLYCSECHQLRCSRCTTEEVVCWYCPSCLFEVASSTVRSEGNRCSRSCYNCPVCTSLLSVSLLDTPTDTRLTADVPSGPFILSCSYCHWTSLDIGIKFEKPNNITGQLQRIRNGGRVVPTPKERESQAQRLLRAKDESNMDVSDEGKPMEAYPPETDDIFSNLNSFYKTQLADSADMATFNGGASEFNISSPGSISRLLNLYSTGKKTKRGKPQPMREALNLGEGLQTFDTLSSDDGVEKLRSQGWYGTASRSQRQFQERNPPRFVADLRPVATLLRTKRSKRCKTCRTLLSRPEPKVSSTRYKIKVLALNNIPKVSLRSLTATPSAVAASLFSATASSSLSDYAALQPLMPYQFLLTLTNPLFDPIQVTLATPATTPGRVHTRVTILCPQFHIGANTDVWDEALSSGAQRRRSGMPSMSLATSNADGKQAEAGKVWEKGRNWTSVIIEVVPGMLPGTTGYGHDDVESALQEDEDVLEVSIFVRLEYETEAGAGEEKRVGEAKEKREVAFWCALGVGRIVG